MLIVSAIVVALLLQMIYTTGLESMKTASLQTYYRLIRNDKDIKTQQARLI